jgi:PAS domain S-box-containing protein
LTVCPARIGNQEIKILKEKLTLITLSIMLGVSIWIIDIFVDSYIFSKGTVSDILTHHISGHEFYFHVFLSAVFIFMALFFSRQSANRKKELEIMKAREHQRNVIANSLPVLIAEVGADERYCFVNDMYEKWYGVSPQHFVGKTVSEVLGKAKYANVQPYIRNVMSGKNVTYEDSFRYPDGSRKDVAVQYIPHFKEDGSVTGFYAMIQDITEQNKTKEEIISLSKFPLENPSLVLRISDTGTVLFKNPAVNNLLKKENLSEGDIFRILPQNTKELIRKILKTNSPQDDLEVKIGDKIYSYSIIPIAENRYVNLYATDITFRKLYENALIESEKKFESLHDQARQDWEDTFETIPDMITIHDRDFNLIHANRAANEILNLPILDPKTINKCFKYYHGTGAPPEGCPSCDCYNTGEPATFEVFEPHLNRYIEIRAIPRFDKDHTLIGLIHVVRDITKRKQMDDKLRESEKRFYAAAICTADLIWESDIRSGSLSWFGDIDSTLGYKAGEFPRTIKGYMESIHPEDLDNVNKAVQKSINSGRKISIDFRMKCKKGIYRYWHESGKAVGFENKKAVKWVGSITDITDRKIAEDRLIENEEKYKKLSQEFHTLLDAIPDSLILLSPELKILWSNTAFDSKIGKKVSTSEVKHCYKLCCNISSPCNNCPVIKCFQSGQEEVTQVTDTDGRILDKRAFPLFDDSGKVSKVIEVSRDVTAKIRMEDEAKLIQSRLIHANKMTSLGALVSGVAHEINNPNSYIMSNTQVFAKIWKDAIEILKENCHDKKGVLIGGIPFPRLLEIAPKLLIGINDGSVRISNIVNNLKDFSQPQRTDMDGKVNVNKVIMSSRSILDHNIKQFTHSFNVNCNENIPPARGNTQQIEQVIINLIMNALQSLPDKTSEIWVSTSHNQKSNTVEIKVRDKGVGMSEDVLNQVTEPFFTTKADAGGTGLGLSISYAIIKDHKGFMSFNSEKGKGTTVTATLPVYDGKDIIE